MKATQALATYVGVKPACDALRVARATFYRRRRPSTGQEWAYYLDRCAASSSTVHK